MGGGPAALNWPELHREAVSLIEEASHRALCVRLLGSAAIRLGSPEGEKILLQMRQVPKDLDFICPREDRQGLRRLFEERGYAVDRDMLVAMEGERYLFKHIATNLKLDLFVDRLEFCHTLHLGGRLGRHALTIPIEDLILSKLQIVKQTEGDLIDLATIFFCHAVGDASGAAAGIDVAYIAGILSRDWGFWRTATASLSQLRRRVLEGGFAALGERVAEVILPRLRLLEEAVEAEPKSLGWKLRSRIGERMQWWQDVDDRQGTY